MLRQILPQAPRRCERHVAGGRSFSILTRHWKTARLDISTNSTTSPRVPGLVSLSFIGVLQKVEDGRIHFETPADLDEISVLSSVFDYLMIPLNLRCC